MQSNTFEVRDLRHSDWVWTNKAVLFHPGVDDSAYKVYCGLSSYAGNEDQRAFPGINTLAKRLHMGRNTVMRALGRLEKLNLVRIERMTGMHNVYYLLSIEGIEYQAPEEPAQRADPEEKRTDEIDRVPTPKEKARLFFDGIVVLMQKGEVPWLQDMLRSIAEKNGVPKSVIWDEVRNFGAHWTEKNATGKRERWEMERTFEVELRLATWFRRSKSFPKSGPYNGSKGKGIIGLTLPIPV